MLYHAAQAGVVNLKDGLLEILRSMRRAGMFYINYIVIVTQM